MLLMSLYTGIPQGRSMPVYAGLYACTVHAQGRPVQVSMQACASVLIQD